ncbi:MAG: UvrD-helicase domain-containing protein [Proteobacteria bacterium]|nr:UvrD-helicase domain-containing protein [Pseudomonadota bacterium]
MAAKRALSTEQARASDPAMNVWVQANAGTGKTSVLVQRLLRILFRNDDDPRAGKNAGILCLTYTNAGASEMRNRILAELREWAYADDAQLRELLADIAHSEIPKTPPTDADLATARAIFYEYIDNPQMLKIRTIHSFCEEILRRFPMEAGISPAWRLVTEADQTRLMKDAFQELVNASPPTGPQPCAPTPPKGGVVNCSLNSEQVSAELLPPWGESQSASLVSAQRDAVGGLTDAFFRITERISEYSYDQLLGVLTDQYRVMFQLNQSFNYQKQFIDTVRNFLSIDPLAGQKFWSPAAMDDRRKILGLLESEILSPRKPAAYLVKAAQVIKKLMHDTNFDFDEYKTAFLTTTGARATRVTKKEYLVAEQDRVYEYDQNRINQAIYDDTVALFTLSDAFTKKYAELKLSRNLMDFDDIILYTERLFSDPATMGWVLSQLDVQLSHILVDEAQDTSPEQWRILRALATNFFTNGEGENPRTLFVVGDTKQSIYSFQGANPVEFMLSKNNIAEQIASDQRVIAEVPLSQSFRSVPAILSTVDYFFNDVSITNLANFKNNVHKCFRAGEAGFVELNSVKIPFSDTETAADDDEIDADDKAPVAEKIKNSVARREYIREIADKIEHLVTNETLESAGRRITPGDIMVLVQKRAPFAAPLVAELKSRNIAVAGSDRIVLPEFPAIRDLLNLVRFCLDTANDYALACVLKSPLFGFSESDLFAICHKRGDDTVFSRINVLRPEIYKELLQILEWANLPPYSFFMRLLNTGDRREKMIAALGGQIIDPLEEFLTIALSYERTQSGGLREFIQWFMEGGSEIKRDMEANSGVRVMTVHAAKGLDSPIVFLIDTIENPKSKREGAGRVVPISSVACPSSWVGLLRRSDSDGGLGGAISEKNSNNKYSNEVAPPRLPSATTPPQEGGDATEQKTTAFLWSPDGNASEKFQAAADARLQTQVAEYYRLLYVAMTRARDRLYIYGFSPTKVPAEIAWHTQLAAILPGHPNAATDANGILRIK